MNLEPEVRDYLCNLGRALEQAEHGQRQDMVGNAAQLLGYSPKWVYSSLTALGFGGGRKSRADRGKSKVNRDHCLKVGGVVNASVSATGKQRMPIKLAVEILKANGELPPDVSPATVATQMKTHKVHPSQMKLLSSHVRMASKHPNHVWQFDVSICVLFYLKGAKSLSIMSEIEFNKNKPKNLDRIVNERVLRYLVTDHWSATFYAEYFLGAGENTENLIAFLLNAFSKRDGDPFHGVPFMLVWDRGSANLSDMAKLFLDRLQVKHHAHETGNARAKGQVEGAHRLVERQFESRLSMCQVNCLEELNTALRRWSLHYNSTVKVTRTGHSRFGFWQTIRQDQLRLCPPRELCKSLLQKAKPRPRIVSGDMRFEFSIPGCERHVYSVRSIPGIEPRDQVEVTYNPYRVPNVIAIYEDMDGNRQEYELEPEAFDEGGFPVGAPVWGENYSSHADTARDKARKEMNQDAYGVDSDLEAGKLRKNGAVAFDGRINPFADVEAATPVEFMERKGVAVALPVPAHLVERKVGYVEAVQKIRGALGIPGGSDAIRRLTRLFKERYPEGIPEAEISGFTEEMRQLFGVDDQPKRAEIGG